jgi:hypothetical protein
LLQPLRIVFVVVGRSLENRLTVLPHGFFLNAQLSVCSLRNRYSASPSLAVLVITHPSVYDDMRRPACRETAQSLHVTAFDNGLLKPTADAHNVSKESESVKKIQLT